ncbi:MAG: hypothetical protein LBC84_10185 [Prevotellaceae bacterium]|nr:hypothetical protein [Prevotellaceae bacterium]
MINEIRDTLLWDLRMAGIVIYPEYLGLGWGEYQYYYYDWLDYCGYYD